MPPEKFHVDGGIRLEAAEVAVTLGLRLAGLGLSGDLKDGSESKLGFGSKVGMIVVCEIF